ncbi:uncharacterized protein LOC104438123 [Eucalyptus grandis]|uniref:uncharacterized protein LOC104438123 n=1 Tax=Eucalyptus grandis TaxID=71139 RepID=UPI00192F04C1|nr:uncharacterized protein LOC104438123 [Eucalyptus grandis]
MATQPSEEQGNWNHAKPAADIEIVCAIVGSASPQSGGASGNSKKEVGGTYYRPLLQAAFKGDWQSAKTFFKQDDASKTTKITSRSETLLHIAALSAQDQFLEKLVKLLHQEKLEALEEVDCDGRTALHNAVLCGRIRMVKALVKSKLKLTQVADNEGLVPLGISAVEASMHKEIAWFLAENTTDEQGHFFSSPSAIKIIINLTKAGHHDITLYLVRRYPQLIDKGRSKHANPLDILDALARNESHFRSGTRLSVFEALIYKCIPVGLNNEPTNKNSDPGFLCKLIVALQYLTMLLWKATKIIVPTIKRIHEMKLRHVAAIELAKKVCDVISHGETTEITDVLEKKDLLLQATISGVTEIVKLCIQYFPELILNRSDRKRLVTEAVKYRQERTLRLFLKVSSTNKLSLVLGPTDEESKMMLMAAAENRAREYYPNFDAETNVAGVAFQMQREVQWYKAVESWVIPFQASANHHKKTHWNEFLEKHKELIEEAEKSMKNTANSCMLVSALIAAVLFAAAFTVPGGNNDKSGVPLLLGQDSFRIFAISDTLGLFSSMTAILIFLGILTSHYEAQDFLYSLPTKIIMGLSLLFLSLASMLVAFVATLTMVLHKRPDWGLIPVALMASIPVVLFAVSQLPLPFQLMRSTYGPSIFHPEDIWD